MRVSRVKPVSPGKRLHSSRKRQSEIDFLGELMIVNGVQFNAELADILNELKEQLATNGIPRFYKMFDSGDDIMVCCPYHKEGQERRPSAGIRKADGLLHCLACGKTVSLDEMVANCFGQSDPAWGYRWLVKNFATVKVEERKPVELNLVRKGINDEVKKLNDEVEEDVDKYRYTHPYMYQRGLTNAVIERFDVGYDPETDSITFPVRGWTNHDFGKCLFIARRAVKTKRFDIPKNVEKPLYGSYEIWEHARVNFTMGGRGVRYPIDAIYVCEGLFDCLRLWCIGKCAVAGFGCLFSEYQMQQLRELPTRKLILATDSDKPGLDARKKIRNAIKNKLITEVILPEGRKDIGECSDEELKNLKEVF